jgi:hypothetical protein
MSVFDDIERNELGPRPYAQPDFNYLNASARPGVHAIRHAIEDWFLHYPNDDRGELRARLRSEDNYQHRSAFFELFLHELLFRLAPRVELLGHQRDVVSEKFLIDAVHSRVRQTVDA